MNRTLYNRGRHHVHVHRGRPSRELVSDDAIVQAVGELGTASTLETLIALDHTGASERYIERSLVRLTLTRRLHRVRARHGWRYGVQGLRGEGA